MNRCDTDNTKQREAVWSIIRDGRWRTFEEINALLGNRYSEAGISARLRDFRKRQFGSHAIERRVRAGSNRLYEYRAVIPAPQQRQQELTFEKEVGNTRSY